MPSADFNTASTELHRAGNIVCGLAARYVERPPEGLNWNTLVLTERGRKTGREISKPLLYLERDGKLYVVASFGGSDQALDWYLNLVANPDVTVERRWAHGALPRPHPRSGGRKRNVA